MLSFETASQSEHLNNHSGAHIQNTKHGEEDYVHGGIICWFYESKPNLI
jgi:hypothetical protein